MAFHGLCANCDFWMQSTMISLLHFWIKSKILWFLPFGFISTNLRGVHFSTSMIVNLECLTHLWMSKWNQGEIGLTFMKESRSIAFTHSLVSMIWSCDKKNILNLNLLGVVLLITWYTYNFHVSMFLFFSLYKAIVQQV